MINLYERNETDFSHNGICVLQPIEAIVSEELNGDYSLKLTMPRGFSNIEVEQVVKAPTPKNPQLFRLYNTDIDMLGNPVFYCRHIFYDLLDYFIEDTRPTGDGVLAISRILDNTPFTGDSDITKQGTAYYQMMNPVNAILGADNSFITVWGGELERDNFTVRMKSQLGADRGVSIRYRKNLTGLRFVTDLSGVATKIMPTGLKEDGQTLLKLPEKYVVSPLIDTYANEKVTRIHYSEIKIGDEMSESQALGALRDAANLEFEKGLDKPQVTATVEFVPLEDTEEYKDFSILESVYLGDSISVHHEDLNIDLVTKIIGFEFNALSKRYNKVTLGNANPKYGDVQRQYTDKMGKEAKLAVNAEISGTETRVMKEFKAADEELVANIEATYVKKTDADVTYATKSELRQTTDAISTEVSKKLNSSELSAKIAQNVESVQTAWNSISEHVKIANDSLKVKDNAIGLDDINFNTNLYMNNWPIFDTTIQTSSDERLKKEIRDSNLDALSVINALACKEFKWRQDRRFEALGFIAQQVKAVNPKFVGERIVDGETYYTLDLMAIIPYLVKAVQELAATKNFKEE